jgi:hypothetical protein
MLQTPKIKIIDILILNAFLLLAIKPGITPLKGNTQNSNQTPRIFKIILMELTGRSLACRKVR